MIGVMRFVPGQLAQITDGKAAWAELFAGIEATFESNAEWAVTLGVIALIGLVVWADWRVARWILRRGGSPRPRR